jgi:hypothetical protein
MVSPKTSLAQTCWFGQHFARERCLGRHARSQGGPQSVGLPRTPRLESGFGSAAPVASPAKTITTLWEADLVAHRRQADI